MIVLEHRDEHDILYAKNELYNVITGILFEEQFRGNTYEDIKVDLETLEVEKTRNGGLSAYIKLKMWKSRFTATGTLEVYKDGEDSFGYFVESILSPRIREHLKAFAKIEKGCK